MDYVELLAAHDRKADELAEAQTSIGTLRELVADQITELDALKLDKQRMANALTTVCKHARDPDTVRTIATAALAAEVAS